MPLNKINLFVIKYIKHIEMAGVLMRIFSFSLVSWMGGGKSVLFVWLLIRQTRDTFLVFYPKKESAYILLNVFWIMVALWNA